MSAVTSKRAKKAAAQPEQAATSPAIKGFGRDLTCRGFQFEIGKTYEVAGKIEPCRNGFHACPETLDPFTVFQFYAPGQSRYCLVEQGGKIVPHADDKAASSIITIGREIGIGELVDRAVQFRVSRTKAIGKNSNSGTCGAASNSGTCGAASNSGDYGAASNSGDYGAAFSHAPGSKVMCEGDGQALYITEFADDGSIKSVACGITGRDGIEAGTWYRCENGRLVAA